MTSVLRATVLLCAVVLPASVAPWQSDVSAYTPCAERLIVRNRGRQTRRLIIERQGGPSTAIVARGVAAGESQDHAATIVPLDRGGVRAMIKGDGVDIAIDSRAERACVVPLPASAPGEPNEDYTTRNSNWRRTGEWSQVPGVILVMWKQPIQRENIDRLIRSTRASLIGATELSGGDALYYFWFDGDDSTGRVARERAETFQRSKAVEVATPMHGGPLRAEREDRLR